MYIFAPITQALPITVTNVAPYGSIFPQKLSQQVRNPSKRHIKATNDSLLWVEHPFAEFHGTYKHSSKSGLIGHKDSKHFLNVILSSAPMPFRTLSQESWRIFSFLQIQVGHLISQIQPLYYVLSLDLWLFFPRKRWLKFHFCQSGFAWMKNCFPEMIWISWTEFY